MHSLPRTKLSGSARARKAITARLTSENWTEMARPAFTAENHVKGMQRWRNKARKDNPTLDDDQVERLAAMLRTQHFSEMGRRSAASRRVARAAGQKVAAAVQAVTAALEPAA